MTVLTTPRLILRPITLDDVDALHAIYSHPEAMRYWDEPPHPDRERTRKLVEGMSRADPAKHVELAITLNGVVIGRAAIWQMPEIGYLLHPDYWRQGYGSEAARALIAHGFDALGLPRITAEIDPDNIASHRMLSKLGFVETGRAQNTLQIGDTWYHSIYLALTPEAFQRG